MTDTARLLKNCIEVASDYNLSQLLISLIGKDTIKSITCKETGKIKSYICNKDTSFVWTRIFKSDYTSTITKTLTDYIRLKQLEQDTGMMGIYTIKSITCKETGKIKS